MKKRIGSLVLATVVSGAIACAQPASNWSQLSLSTSRVDEFLKANPKSDGSGVIIAVLDTGVDPSIPGLTTTPDGGVKVIDVQDFSGQGDIELHRVHIDDETGKLVNHDKDGSPIQYELPSLPGPNGEEQLFWFGFFNEANFVNSSVADLNDNGTTDDKFPMFVTALSGDGDDQAVCYIDTNLDRSFADEKSLRSYKLDFDTFTLHRDQPEKQIVPVTFAVNIFLRKSKIVVVYDDGAHGTHVAGIAAGYHINNQTGFNGVAPGAKLMGLKISQNATGSVSTTSAFKRALKHAAKFGREKNMPVVCNLSFGVESVIEGNSDIDKFFDKFLRKNPHVVFCTSAGNEGPGLSSVGTPAAATEVISVGALLAADSARDVMGFTIPEAVATVFTSRGGEADKPDFAVPGWSTSTVPRWVKRGDYWAGTSMASPYAAGLCAVLISDAIAKHPGAKVRTCDVRKALCLSAKPIAGASPLDVGAGLPDLPKAAKLLDGLMKVAKDDPIIGYDISTPCPHGYDGKARAAYWRSTWFPTEDRQTFTIKPVFAPGTDAAARTSFTRKFDLRSKADWCKLTQTEVYLRSEQSARVYVEYDAAKLATPGLYVGVVEAIADGQVAFTLRNTIIVPHRGDEADDYALSFKNQTVSGWTPTRYFLAVPPGTSSMKLTLKAPEGQESKASFERIYDPTGARHRSRSKRLDTTNAKHEAEWTFSADLMPGVWEVPMVSNRPDRDWPFDLEARFFGLHVEPETITEWSGSEPEGELTVTNIFHNRFPGSAKGVFEGFRKTKEDKFKGLKDELSYSLTLDEKYNRIRLELEMTPEAYATTTDIGIAVEVGGKEVYSTAFSNRIEHAMVPISTSGDATSVKVIIRGGFAVADDKRETPITVKIDQLLADPVSIKVKQGDASGINFVPGVPIKLDFSLASAPPATPDGLKPVGYLQFSERSSGDVSLRVPIEIDD